MKTSLSWLADFVSTTATPAELEAGLIQLGHEVEGLHDTAAAFAHVVLGHIVERVQHPQADRLGVCQVDVGAAHGGVRQIVCGAPNARAGLNVAVALPGAALPPKEPGGEAFKIGTSKIRGMESNGMICSQRELGLGNEYDGIWELDAATVNGAALGTPLAAVLGVGDVVLDVAVTPNRGDVLSHLGVAREVAGLGAGTLKKIEVATAGSAAAGFSVATASVGCPTLYALRVSGVVNGPSPAEVQARLEAVGLRPKNILVDATNYTMLALGQPLHAYDAAKLKGGLEARDAAGDEAFAGLGDVNVTLRAGDVVIADADGIVGLAGILGGTRTAVSDATTDVLLEAAYFEPASIALSGQYHGILTDARSRFERGIDPAGQERALLFCAKLIADWSGKTVETSRVERAGAGVPAPQPIAYDPALCATFGGLDVALDRQEEILNGLGFTVTRGHVWQVTAPAFRTYMANPEDIVEEVLRVVGFENVPGVLPQAQGLQPVDGSRVELDRKARRMVAAAGFVEVMTYSFISAAHAQAVAGGTTTVGLTNPLAMDSMTTLRPSLLPGLLLAARANAAQSDVQPRLAEVGKVYHAGGERLMAAGVLLPEADKHWRRKAAAPDVFSAKGAALAVLEALGAPVGSAVVEGPDMPMADTYHPGKSGVVRVGPMVLARFGEIHPRLLKAFDLPAGLYPVFELELETLLKLQSKPRPFALNPYPPVKRDLAFVVADVVRAGDVAAVLRSVDRTLVSDVRVFDQFILGEGRKSLAFNLVLQSADKTLAEADIKPVLDAAVALVKERFGGELRS